MAVWFCIYVTTSDVFASNSIFVHISYNVKMPFSTDYTQKLAAL